MLSKSAIRFSLIPKERAFVAEILQISECQNFGLANLMLRKNTDVVATGAALEVTMPDGPRCVAGDGLVLIGHGPGSWFAFAEQASLLWATELEARLPGVSISDQSSGYVILKITGSAARALLQRGAFIDLDPSTFNVGSAAVTVIAHIGVLIWQIESSETFHVAVFRGFAESFREFIQSASPLLNA